MPLGDEFIKPHIKKNRGTIFVNWFTVSVIDYLPQGNLESRSCKQEVGPCDMGWTVP